MHKKNVCWFTNDSGPDEAEFCIFNIKQMNYFTSCTERISDFLLTWPPGQERTTFYILKGTLLQEFLLQKEIKAHLRRFFLLGSSAKTPGRNRELLSWHLTITRAPTYSCSNLGVVSKAMWWPDTRLLPFSSKLTLYFNRPSSANKEMSLSGTGQINIAWNLHKIVLILYWTFFAFPLLFYVTILHLLRVCILKKPKVYTKGSYSLPKKTAWNALFGVEPSFP